MQSHSDSKPDGATLVLFETEHLKANIRSALVEAALSPWQRNFLSDVLTRLERYGSRSRLSDKQLLKLHEILGGNGTRRQEALTKSRPTRLSRRPRFRSPSFLSRRIRWWRRRLVRDAVVVALIIMVGLVYSVFETAPVQSFVGAVGTSSHVMGPVDQAFSVTDGDTVHIAGERAGTRLVGFNTPEKFSPQCEYERKLGERASSRLKELVKSPNLQLTKVPCACPAGSEGKEIVSERDRCGAMVEFHKKADAMLFKLAQCHDNSKRVYGREFNRDSRKCLPKILKSRKATGRLSARLLLSFTWALAACWPIKLNLRSCSKSKTLG